VLKLDISLLAKGFELKFPLMSSMVSWGAFVWKCPRVLWTPGLACKVSKSRVMLFEVYYFIWDCALICSIFDRLIPFPTAPFLETELVFWTSCLPFFLLPYFVIKLVALLLVLISCWRLVSISFRKGFIRLFLLSVPPVVPERFDMSLTPESYCWCCCMLSCWIWSWFFEMLLF
jgi:hypothetical protein